MSSRGPWAERRIRRCSSVPKPSRAHPAALTPMFASAPGIAGSHEVTIPRAGFRSGSSWKKEPRHDRSQPSRVRLGIRSGPVQATFEYIKLSFAQSRLRPGVPKPEGRRGNRTSGRVGAAAQLDLERRRRRTNRDHALSDPESPPPGVVLKTVTSADSASARSPLSITAVRRFPSSCAPQGGSVASTPSCPGRCAIPANLRSRAMERVATH